MNLRAVYRSTMGYLSTRRRAYVLAFSSPAGQEVLADLARFCRAGETTLHADARIHASLEGRREVWLRIMQHLHEKPDELYRRYGGPAVNLTASTEEDDGLQ